MRFNPRVSSSQENKKIWMKGLRRDFCSTLRIRYNLPTIKTDTYSLVIFGKCNYRCKFCFVGGRFSKNGILPGASLYSFEEIKSFVIEECERGRAIRISGGEPTLFPEEVITLLKIIKDYEGFSIIDTNGSRPEIVSVFANYADILSIDCLKAPYNLVTEVTKTSKKLCWDAPHKTIKMCNDFPCYVEYKTTLIKPIDYNFLEYIYSILPSHIQWTLKLALNEKSNFPRDLSKSLKREIITLDNDFFLSPEELLKVAELLVEEHRDLKGRLVCITGSNRLPESYRKF